MGYPMTFQRLLNRNQIADGTYEAAPETWRPRVNLQVEVPAGAKDGVLEVRRKQLIQYETQAKMLAGDLQRFLKDAVDERAVCTAIAERTQLDADTVAAVIKEFLAL